MNSASFYKWRAKHGDIDASMVARLKELEDENRRLKKMYAEERLKAEIIQEAMAKKWCGHLSARKWLNVWSHIRLACSAFQVSESCYRYQPVLSSENKDIAD
ncbi:MAG: putative transposase [Paracoccaceae bacterium]|jgi:putative transposase